MNSTGLKLAAVCTAIFTALASILSVFTLDVSAFDNNDVIESTVSVALHLEDVSYIEEALAIIKSSEHIDEIELYKGSGFFLGSGNNPQYIVTSYSVIKEYMEYLRDGLYSEIIDESSQSFLGIKYTIEAVSCELRIYYSDGSYDIATVECYEGNDGLDLAVLKIQESTKGKYALKIASVSDVDAGDVAYVAGYPDNLLDGKQTLGDFTIDDGTIAQIFTDDKGVEKISIETALQNISPGGPIVNEDGEVLGVNITEVSSDDVRNCRAISSGELMKFLDKNGIPYKKAGGNTAVIVIAVICAALVAVAIAFAVKKKAALPKKTPSAATDTKPSVPVVPPAQAAPYAQHTSAKKAFIRSMSAQHNGKTFPVGKAPVVIGRDLSSCVIVFEEGTPGVSCVHCSVSYDSETDIFTLTDLGSTYGTYLIGGQQVPAKASLSLKSGCSFYVGDKSNVCRVEVVK